MFETRWMVCGCVVLKAQFHRKALNVKSGTSRDDIQVQTRRKNSNSHSADEIGAGVTALPAGVGAGVDTAPFRLPYVRSPVQNTSGLPVSTITTWTMTRWRFRSRWRLALSCCYTFMQVEKRYFGSHVARLTLVNGIEQRWGIRLFPLRRDPTSCFLYRTKNTQNMPSLNLLSEEGHIEYAMGAILQVRPEHETTTTARRREKQ